MTWDHHAPPCRTASEGHCRADWSLPKDNLQHLQTSQSWGRPPAVYWLWEKVQCVHPKAEDLQEGAEPVHHCSHKADEQVKVGSVKGLEEGLREIPAPHKTASTDRMPARSLPRVCQKAPEQGEELTGGNGLHSLRQENIHGRSGFQPTTWPLHQLWRGCRWTRQHFNNKTSCIGHDAQPCHIKWCHHETSLVPDWLQANGRQLCGDPCLQGPPLFHKDLRLKDLQPKDLWPPQNPDFNLLDFAILGHVESEACKACHNTIGTLKRSVEKACPWAPTTWPRSAAASATTWRGWPPGGDYID